MRTTSLKTTGEAQTAYAPLKLREPHLFMAHQMLLACACALSRRAVLTAAPAALALGSGPARAAMNIEYVKSPGGVEYAELKAGTGAAPRVGQRATIDYMMTRRGGAKIYSSVDSKQPFSYVIGDGTVIEGLEQAVLGSEGMLPLLPGGVRRVIVPQARGYGVKLASWETAVREVGPIPPEFVWTDPQGDKVNSYARFKNIYLNPNRIDQPDLLLDVKLLRVENAEPEARVESAS